MLCSLCKAKDATVHLTQITGDKLQKVDLCEECAKQKGVNDPTGFSLADLLLGLGASQEMEQRSGGYFKMKEGLLYPALHRMQQNGWLTSEWKEIEGRSRKYYTLTTQGKKALGEQANEWKTFIERLGTVLDSGDS
jgi:hypothetical protein